MNWPIPKSRHPTDCIPDRPTTTQHFLYNFQTAENDRPGGFFERAKVSRQLETKPGIIFKSWSAAGQWVVTTQIGCSVSAVIGKNNATPSFREPYPQKGCRESKRETMALDNSSDGQMCLNDWELDWVSLSPVGHQLVTSW